MAFKVIPLNDCYTFDENQKMSRVHCTIVKNRKHRYSLCHEIVYIHMHSFVSGVCMYCLFIIQD